MRASRRTITPLLATNTQIVQVAYNEVVNVTTTAPWSATLM